jgi:hypothetical protein
MEHRVSGEGHATEAQGGPPCLGEVSLGIEPDIAALRSRLVCFQRPQEGGRQSTVHGKSLPALERSDRVRRPWSHPPVAWSRIMTSLAKQPLYLGDIEVRSRSSRERRSSSIRTTFPN